MNLPGKEKRIDFYGGLVSGRHGYRRGQVVWDRQDGGRVLGKETGIGASREAFDGQCRNLSQWKLHGI